MILGNVYPSILILIAITSALAIPPPGLTAAPNVVNFRILRRSSNECSTTTLFGPYTAIYPFDPYNCSDSFYAIGKPDRTSELAVHRSVCAYSLPSFRLIDWRRLSHREISIHLPCYLETSSSGPCIHSTAFPSAPRRCPRQRRSQP